MCSCRGDAQSAQGEEEREGELLCLKIKDQLEDLLSDSHLAKDGFLLKHVQRNKQGYVSLKLLTCSKKVKISLWLQDFMCFQWCLHSTSLNENNQMQTKLRLPLFVTDKGADHKVVHDRSSSDVLRASGGER